MGRYQEVIKEGRVITAATKCHWFIATNEPKNMHSGEVNWSSALADKKCYHQTLQLFHGAAECWRADPLQDVQFSPHADLTEPNQAEGAQFWVKHNPHSNSNSCIQS